MFRSVSDSQLFVQCLQRVADVLIMAFKELFDFVTFIAEVEKRPAVYELRLCACYFSY